MNQQSLCINTHLVVKQTGDESEELKIHLLVPTEENQGNRLKRVYIGVNNGNMAVIQSFDNQSGEVSGQQNRAPGTQRYVP